MFSNNRWCQTLPLGWRNTVSLRICKATTERLDLTESVVIFLRRHSPEGNVCNYIRLEGKVRPSRWTGKEPCVLTGDLWDDDIHRVQIFHILYQTRNFVGLVLNSLPLSGNFLLEQEKGLHGLFIVLKANGSFGRTQTAVELTLMKFHQTDQIPTRGGKQNQSSRCSDCFKRHANVAPPPPSRPTRSISAPRLLTYGYCQSHNP